MKILEKICSPLGWLSLGLLGYGIWHVLNTPADFQQGNSVAILFVHVSAAKMALFFYLVLVAASIRYLWKKGDTADTIAEASVHVGAAFSVVTLATGSIWGKPMWGTWWAWDARLTSMLMLLIIYVGLIALRGALEDRQRGAKAAAIFALIGAVDLPLIHFSVVWWRTLHQPASLGNGAPKLVGPMLTTLAVMGVAFTVLGTYMLVLKTLEVREQRRLHDKEEEHFHNG